MAGGEKQQQGPKECRGPKIIKLFDIMFLVMKIAIIIIILLLIKKYLCSTWKVLHFEMDGTLKIHLQTSCMNARSMLCKYQYNFSLNNSNRKYAGCLISRKSNKSLPLYIIPQRLRKGCCNLFRVPRSHPNSRCNNYKRKIQRD